MGTFSSALPIPIAPAANAQILAHAASDHAGSAARLAPRVALAPVMPPAGSASEGSAVSRPGQRASFTGMAM
jgi:hypothetical protein